MNDNLLVLIFFAVGLALAGVLSFFIFPRLCRGWPLHLLRGVTFGALCGAAFIRKCDEYLVPGWLLWIARRPEDIRDAVAATGPGFAAVALPVILLSFLFGARQKSAS